MRKVKYLVLAAAAMLVSLFAQAQSIKVTGVVLDQNSEPLVGAFVQEAGVRNGTATGLDGEFTLTVKPGATLEISMLNYSTKTVSAVAGRPMRIVLEDDSTVLDATVVVGYGSAKKVNSLVGSVTTVKSDAIKNAPSSSALDMLQGQVAGLSVLTSGGVAGDNSVSMTLHGVGSLTSSSTPLYMIDGVPASARSIMALNPNDIESISVLKDASATSIYGSRAANGVVFVITKSGSYNNDATVTARSQWGISTATNLKPYTNMMTGPELKNFWNTAGIHSAKFIYDNYTSQGYDADTRWYQYVQQFNNPQIQNDIAVEGGGQRVAYMIGGSQFHQRGNTIGNVYDRYTVRSNVQGRPKDWLKVGANLNFTFDRTRTNPNWSNSSSNANYTSGGLSYLANPLYPAIDPETGKEYEIEYPGGMINHHTYVKYRDVHNDRYSVMGNAFVEIDPIRNLKLVSRAGVDGFLNLGTGSFSPEYELLGGSGWRSRSMTLSYTATITNTAEYSFNIGQDHDFTVLVGHEGIQNYTDYFYASSEDLRDKRLLNLQDGDQKTYDESESMSESRFLSFFGHADYTLMGKYIFDASIRADASSRFGKNVRWAPFWAVGALWKIKKEDFMRSVRWLDDLNFKASYGTQGNAAIGNYSSLPLLSRTEDYNSNATLFFSQIENPLLTWEKQSLLTLALTGRAFNRLDFDIEYYNRFTSNMLMSAPYPYTTGFGAVMQNVGNLMNQGVDITLGVDILRGRDYFLRASATFNYNAEKITSLFNDMDEYEIANTGVAYVVGYPVMYLSPIYAGVDRTDGRPMWYVPGEDIYKTTKGETTKTFSEESLKQNTGYRRHAPVNGGFSISGAWKNLSMVADFSYVLGKYMLNNDAYFYANPNVFADNNQNRSISDFWTESNPDAKWPDWRKGVEMQFDTHLLENASFMRLKNLQIGYSLPKSLMQKMGIFRDFKITFTGRNLLTFTNYTGLDPEDDTNVSLGLPANTKQYMLGLELTF